MKPYTSLLRLFLPATVALFGSLAHADVERGFYAGGGVSAINIDKSSSFDKADLWMAEVFGGYKYNAWVGAEVRYGTGLGREPLKFGDSWDDMLQEEDLELLIDLNHYRAIYYRAEAVNETGRFYGLVGYAEVDYTISGAGQYIDLEESGLSWGVGFGFFLSPELGLNFEYKNLVDMDEANFSTLTVALDYRF